IARQFELAAPSAVVDQRHNAKFRICIRRDTNGTARLDVGIASAKLGAAGVNVEFRFDIGLAQWLYANRPHAVVAEVAYVIELAPTVARGILAPAGDIQAAPGAVAGGSPGDHHA